MRIMRIPGVYRLAARVSMTALAVTLLFGWLPAFVQSAAADTEPVIVLANQGVVFDQVDFLFPKAPLPNSDWGRMTADGLTLLKSTGMRRGYLNVFTDAGWVVDNLLVDVNGVNTITAYFTLGLASPEDVGVLSAYIEFSSTPRFTFADGLRSDFPVGTSAWNAQGGGDEDVTEIGPAPPPRPPSIISIAALPEEGEECLQSDAENVETAVNQCVPMSVANSLQFLENSTGISMPHDHEIGLRGDDSLVGQLGEAMDRTVVDRSNGSGLWFTPMLEGKFEYLVDNGLQDSLEHKHQGRGYGQTIPDGDFEHMGITSVDNGDTVTWEFICNEICDGEDVELIYRHSTGGHAVRVVGCGITQGKRWIMYAHDANQSNDTAGLETVKVNIEDLDTDGTLNLGAESREIFFILSESTIAIPEPPVCDANGPYVADCQGLGATVQLDGSGSSDPDSGDVLSYSWSTDCPGATFDNPAIDGPQLDLAFSTCPTVCTASLTVTDNSGFTDNCSSTVTIFDETEPQITCPANVTIACDESTDPSHTGVATATDVCGPNPPNVQMIGETSLPGDCLEEQVITRTWVATDMCSNSDACDQTINLVDTTAPEIECNAPATIIPPDAPISFTATASDNCAGTPSVEITGYDCFKFTKKGKRIDKTKSCVVGLDGDTVTIIDSGGVNDHITWTIQSIDNCGNVNQRVCEVDVVNPGKH